MEQMVILFASVVKKRHHSFSINGRRIPNSKLGRASVTQEASARLNKGSQNVSSGGTCYSISRRNFLCQPPEDSVYPGINNGAK